MTPFDYNRWLFLEETQVSPDSRNMTGIKLVRMLKALQSAHSDVTVVDLGCGVGSFTSRIKQAYPDHDVIGLDISGSALELAADHHPYLMFVRGDVTDLPFADKSIDAVGGLDILEHLQDVDCTIKEIHRVLKTGGKAHFHVPCEGQPWTLWWLLWKTGLPAGDLKRKHAGHIQRFTHKGILEKFKDYGFIVVKIEYSVHIIGQLLDFLQWWATSVRRRFSIAESDTTPVHGCKPEANTAMTLNLLLGSYRLFVRFLEVVSYYETKMLRKIGLAMAVDVTLEKRQHPQRQILRR